jgi:hypothetical protein
MTDAPAPAAAPATAGTTRANFRGATQPTVGVGGSQSQTVAMTTAVQPLTTWFLPPNNVIRGIVIEVTAVVPSNNSATVAFAADAPLNWAATLAWTTSGGTPIVGAFNSYDHGIVQKYGGYRTSNDPRTSSVYQAVTGSGVTGGNFTIVQRIPVEVVSRTGLGSLSNTSTESPMQLQMTLNASTAIYTTAPTALPNVTVKTSLLGYWSGPSGRATPLAFGTTSFWNEQTYNGMSGQQNTTLQAPPGFGNPQRMWVFINRLASNGARSSTAFPTSMLLQFRGNPLLDNIDQLLWQDEMSRDYGYGNAIDTPGGLDTGVFIVNFNRGTLDKGVGAETVAGYLDTDGGDPLALNGSFATASNLFLLSNFLNVVGNLS